MLINRNIEATLKNNSTLEVRVKKANDSSFVEKMRFYEDYQFKGYLEFLSKSESKSTYIYIFRFNYEIIPGKSYAIANGENEFCPINISCLGSNLELERDYRYDGELGAIYCENFTIFRVFTPLSSAVNVNIIKPDGTRFVATMNRIEGGVYEAKVEGDLDRCKYTYLANLNGEYVEAVDPYAKSVDTNSRFGYVVNMKRLDDVLLNDEFLPPFSISTQAVIYECNVRDMTSLTNLPDKGTYNALAKAGLADAEGHPIGLDYIASLGVSHVQLMPIYDFQTIDDSDPLRTYNWGYDPEFYFAVEGSYASNPEDPYVRMRELRNLVASFHRKGIRVNMDVVFNHVFRTYSNSLEILCPNYYFRLNSDGTLSNGSGCGNDFESRHYMARKLIIDALKFFMNHYGIDGYRFDLIGIIDIDTIKSAYSACKGIKSNLMFYGEGWDLATSLPSVQKTTLNNAMKIPEVGFFNDRFRDIIKGHTYGEDMNGRGYLSGDANYIDGFKHVFLGSVISLAFPPLFTLPSQSINYVECHDNETLFDKLKVCCANENDDTIVKRVKLINAVNILAFGVPFIHAGQEIASSKKGDINSYISGDKINGFDYHLAAERQGMVAFFHDCIKLKKYSPYFSLNDKLMIEKSIDFVNLDYGAIAIKYYNERIGRQIIVIINPSKVVVKYNFGKYYKIIFNEAGFIEGENYAQLVLVNGISMVVAVAS